MKVNYPPAAVINLISSILDRVAYARALGQAANVKPDLFELYTLVEHELNGLKSAIEVGYFTLEYVNQLAESLNKFTHGFRSSYGPGERVPITLQESEKLNFKNQQEGAQPTIELALSQFARISDFFMKLDFLNRDLVVVGANGSGKTFLANALLKHVKNNGIIISAQRILYFPNFDNIKSPSVTIEELKQVQTSDKTSKNLDFEMARNEFGILIQSLLANDVAEQKEYKRRAHESANQGDPIEPPRLTILERTLNIWNNLFKYPQILHDDGINIKAHTSSVSYSAKEMSEGEKVTLFLIAQVLQAPEQGFVIVDEPEMYLHPTIHKKLWDKLQDERPDAIFIYLTHDLEFASSRVHAKKLWLQSFQYPDVFKLQEIPQNEIPQPLLMELLGSRQDIIFCEGKSGSLDEQIYTILFPHHTIKPVGGCKSVIDYTKAFNKIPLSCSKAIGIVDRDFLTQRRVDSLQTINIFPIDFPDIENILLDENLLFSLAKELSCGDNAVTMIKQDILKKLDTDKAVQVAKYVSSRVDLYFKDTNVSMGTELEKLKSNFYSFIEKVTIDSWAQERTKEINEVVSKKDYLEALRIFKDGGLGSIVKRHLRIRDFERMAINLLRRNGGLRAELRIHIPNIPT